MSRDINTAAAWATELGTDALPRHLREVASAAGNAQRPQHAFRDLKRKLEMHGSWRNFEMEIWEMDLPTRPGDDAAVEWVRQPQPANVPDRMRNSAFETPLSP